MRVGVPKETWPGESRVAVIPAGAATLAKAGLQIAIEEGAGIQAGFTDEAYAAQGASVVPRRDVFETSQIILQVRATPPDGALKSGQAVIGFADTGLKEDYGNLGWVVLAAQDTSEAFAPIHVVDRIVAMMSILGLLAVTLFAVWVSIHRVERFEHLGEVREPTETRTASV